MMAMLGTPLFVCLGSVLVGSTCVFRCGDTVLSPCHGIICLVPPSSLDRPPLLVTGWWVSRTIQVQRRTSMVYRPQIPTTHHRWRGVWPHHSFGRTSCFVLTPSHRPGTVFQLASQLQGRKCVHHPLNLRCHGHGLRYRSLRRWGLPCPPLRQRCRPW